MLYGMAYQYAYVSFVNAEYEYAHFLYNAPSTIVLAIAYALIAIPVIAYRPSPAIAAYGAALIYAICYVPAQLIMLFNWDGSLTELLIVQVSVAISMTIILRAATLGADPEAKFETAVSRESQLITPSVSVLLTIMTAVSTLLLVFYYRQYMRIVSLDDIYDLRFESSQADYGFLANYTQAWLSLCFLPFYYVRGILRKDPFDLAIAIIVSTLLYATFGSKTALLMGVCVYGLLLLYRAGDKFLFRLLTALLVIVLVVALIPDDEYGPTRWLKAMTFIRLLGTNGWSMSVYYEFFSTNGFTYYTHIGPINAVTGAYPYGNLQLGQVIGLQYSGSEEANFNASFWASDAFAAAGIYGVPIVTAALCAIWYAFNRAARGFPTGFAVLWLCGFWQGLLNSPLTVAMLSGGGIIVMLLFRLNVLTSKAAHAPNAFAAAEDASADTEMAELEGDSPKPAE